MLDTDASRRNEYQILSFVSTDAKHDLGFNLSILHLLRSFAIRTDDASGRKPQGYVQRTSCAPAHNNKMVRELQLPSTVRNLTLC